MLEKERKSERKGFNHILNIQSLVEESRVLLSILDNGIIQRLFDELSLRNWMCVNAWYHIGCNKKLDLFQLPWWKMNESFLDQIDLYIYSKNIYIRNI